VTTACYMPLEKSGPAASMLHSSAVVGKSDEKDDEKPSECKHGGCKENKFSSSIRRQAAIDDESATIDDESATSEDEQDKLISCCGGMNSNYHKSDLEPNMSTSYTMMRSSSPL